MSSTSSVNTFSHAGTNDACAPIKSSYASPTVISFGYLPSFIDPIAPPAHYIFSSLPVS